MASEMQATIGRENATGRGMSVRNRSVAEKESAGFVRQLDCLLHRLSDLHLRLSLCRLQLVSLGDEAPGIAQAIVDNLRDPTLLAGVMPDGSVVAACLGPRGDGAAGDRQVAKRMAQQFEAALHAVGLESVASSQSLTVAHCWSDEIYDVPALVLDLATLRQAPRGSAVIFDHDRRWPLTA